MAVAHCAFVVLLGHVMRWRVVWTASSKEFGRCSGSGRVQQCFARSGRERGGRIRWEKVVEARVRLREGLGGSTVR